MRPLDEMEISRRKFLKATAVAGGLAAARVANAAEGRGVSIITSPDDSLVRKPIVRWAVDELKRSITARGIEVRSHEKVEQAAAGDFCLVVAGTQSPLSRAILKSAGVSVPQARESLAIVPGKAAGRKVLLACGPDARGLNYALLEIADRVNHAQKPLAEIDLQSPIVERPVNVIRAADRCFSSSVEDNPWYNDRSMWPSYLNMLSAARFNRFTLSFGLGYDYPQRVKDAYFYFAYPFLVSVPGYNVRAVGLPDSERDRNLEMLRYISDEVAGRGMDFQLGLWNHGYQWPKGSDANYTIAGLTPENHARYCRDALYAVLQACRGINGVVLRVHGESGIPEQNFAFWQTLLEGVVRTGRRIEINLHAKGMSQRMIDIALATHLPVTLSPKYWAEHCGLPYQPASIRKKEMPPLHPEKKGFFDLSEGSRRFLRYSYGDLLKRDRTYGVIFRIWPGTQRCLLWGDPVMAAGDAQAGSFCGCLGIDLFEPLTFKGRHGSGLPGGRCAYEDDSFKPRHDWEKFEYSYRVWGRNLYNPKTDPDGWRRLMRTQLRTAAPEAEKALANASRILRLVTAARGPSAANNTYWPEMYTNMPIVDAAANHLYHDTLPPRIFNNVSPFDPEMFSQINDFADEMLKGNRTGKYSPLEVAQWLEDFAQAATDHLAEAGKHDSNPPSPDFQRLAVDVSIQAGLGRFFAWKTRSGVLYALHDQRRLYVRHHLWH
ncbi:MAG: twin-arginine translocation signal domain-containing protein [Acidobacteriota bacterium]